jgi:lauroyl/myristoyl acyltransferase
VGTFAERTGAAIVPVHAIREPSGTLRVTIEPELELGAARRDPRTCTALLAKLTEDWIRRDPAQWLWAHRRFKNVTWPETAPRQ